MDNRAILQQSLDYIEDNLRAEITAQELADLAGFSLFHYYRLFQQATGLPVMQYILRRKRLARTPRTAKEENGPDFRDPEFPPFSPLESPLIHFAKKQ